MKSSLVLLLAPLAALAAPAHEPRQAAESIDELIKAKGKLYYGTCTDQNRLSTGKSADIIKGNFGQVTPENSMKWDVSGVSSPFREKKKGGMLFVSPTDIIIRPFPA